MMDTAQVRGLEFHTPACLNVASLSSGLWPTALERQRSAVTSDGWLLLELRGTCAAKGRTVHGFVHEPVPFAASSAAQPPTDTAPTSGYYS